MNINTIKEEAEQYKGVSKRKLNQILFAYKFLSLANSKNFNFIFTLIFMLIPYFVISTFSPITMALIMLLHYVIYCEFLYKRKNVKLVSDKDKGEIDEVIKILKTYK